MTELQEGVCWGLCAVRRPAWGWECEQHMGGICPSLDKSTFWKLRGQGSWKCCSLLRHLLGMHFTVQCGSRPRILGGISPCKVFSALRESPESAAHANCSSLCSFQLTGCWHRIHPGHRPEAGQMDLGEGIDPANSSKCWCRALGHLPLLIPGAG